MICDSFEYNLNPKDIIGSKNDATIQKIKYTAITIDPLIIEFGFAL